MDGFYDRRNCESSTGNPSGWAGYTGQDFMPQHAVRAIDYAAMHLWPDNWKRYDLDFGSGWMRNHTDDARRLGKPLVLEEFGKARRTRCATASTARGLNLQGHSSVVCQHVTRSQGCSAAYWMSICASTRYVSRAADAGEPLCALLTCQVHA